MIAERQERLSRLSENIAAAIEQSAAHADFMVRLGTTQPPEPMPPHAVNEAALTATHAPAVVRDYPYPGTTEVGVRPTYKPYEEVRRGMSLAEVFASKVKPLHRDVTAEKMAAQNMSGAGTKHTRGPVLTEEQERWQAIKDANTDLSYAKFNTAW